MKNDAALSMDGLQSGDSAGRASCPVCRCPSTEDFFHLPQLPVHVGVVYDSPTAARQAAMGKLTLAWCSGCGFVFNRDFEPQRLIFTPGYQVQLVHSTVFASFLRDLAERLIESYDLYAKDIIDIGCGAGHFLRMLCEAGGNRGLGIDPTLACDGHVALPGGQMQLQRAVFGDDLATTRQFDFATCQSVLEDVAEPVAFLQAARRLLEARGGHAYLEVFNAFRAFEAGEVWSLTYEQCNYYSLASFRTAIRRAGFDIAAAGTCYGDGQYLYVEATPATAPAPCDQHSQGPPAVISRFADVHQQRLALWKQRIASLRAADAKAAVWGTGGKGVCFLNTVGAQDVFAWAVDVNPDRQGKHVPGSGQKIVSPGDLRQLRPDVIVITNPLYESEIRQAVSELSLECDFLTI
jgi:SAM-dependent methyltransferase